MDRLVGILILIFGGCAAEPATRLELALYDGRVRCQPWPGEVCQDAEGKQAAAEPLGELAFVSRRVSQFGEAAGYYLYFEATRQNGAVAVLEMDLPLAGQAEPRISYREMREGTTTFEASLITGQVQVPSDGSCACQDGRLELRLVAAGSDGVLGSDDDEERRLSQGHFWQTDVMACWTPRLLPLATPVIVLPTCAPVPVTSSPPAPGPDPSIDLDVGCGGEEPDYYEEPGCDAESSEPAPAEGCQGDGLDEGSCESSSGSGCEGDTGAGCDSGGDFSGGCEGGGAAADCSLNPGVRLRSAGRARAPRRPGGFRVPGLLVPFAVFGLLHVLLSRRRRRQ